MQHVSNTSKIKVSSFHTGNYITMSLYILERPSSRSTSRIRPSCPQSRVRQNLLLDLFPQVYSCLFWPTQCLAVCSNGSHFALNPFLACWWPNTHTSKQHLSTISHTHGHTYFRHIDIIIHSSSLHFFYSFWQAGCPRPFSSGTFPPFPFLFYISLFSLCIFMFSLSNTRLISLQELFSNI